MADLSWADATEDWADQVDKSDTWADTAEKEKEKPAEEETKPSFSWGAPISYKDEKDSKKGDVRGLDDAFPLPGEKAESRGSSRSGGGAYKPPRRDDRGFGSERDVIAELPKGPSGDDPRDSRDVRDGDYGRPRDDRGDRGGYDRDRYGGGRDRDDRGGYERRDDGYGRDRYERRDDGYGRDRRDRQDDGYGRDRYERRDDGYGRDRYSRDRYDDDRSGDREEREPTPFPDSPPWTAFVGNLPFRAQDQDIGEYFEGNGCKVEDVRLIQDQEGRMKGYGYIEFADADSLKQALTFDGESLLGRGIRVDVASGRRGGDRHTREGRYSTPSEGKWERGSMKPEPRYQPREPRDNRYGSDRYGGDRSGGDRYGDRDAPPRRYGARGGDRSEAPRREPREPRVRKPSGANPFGAAKPRDEAAAQAKIQAMLAEKEAAAKKDAPVEKPAGGSAGGRRGWEKPRRDDGDRRPAGGRNRGWEKPRQEREEKGDEPKAAPKKEEQPKAVAPANAFALLGEEEG